MQTATPHPRLLPPTARPRTIRAVTREALQRGLEQAAAIVRNYGDQYLPVFERLERELQEWDAQASIRDRALAVASRSAIEGQRLMIEDGRKK
jgi:hypothetical protein